MASGTETWTGTNGAAWPSPWGSFLGGTGNAQDIQSNRGRQVTSSVVAGYFGTRAIYGSATDLDISVTVQFDKTGDSWGQINFRSDGAWNANSAVVSNGYMFYIDVASQALVLQRVVSNTQTTIAQTSFTLSINTEYRIRLVAKGSRLLGKIWAASDGEPSEWTVDAWDTTYTSSGEWSLAASSGNTTSVTYLWDDLVWDDTPQTPAAPPFYKAAGTPQESQSAITVPWPTHAIGDIGLLIIESCGGEPANLTTANGFAAVTNSPSATGATTNGTQITIYWCRATSTSQASPVVTDPGNHVYGVILTFAGCAPSGNPWDVTAAAVKASASTSMTLPAVTTTTGNDLIVLGATRDNDSASAAGSSPSNANLFNLTERFDLGTALGNGGGIMVWTGVKATPGSTGTTSATVTSSINAYLTVALRPPPVPPTVIRPATPPGGGWINSQFH